MNLLFVVCLLSIPIRIFGTNSETIIQSPFYLRARMHDYQTASIQFEIGLNDDQRRCQMYKFTIHHNNQDLYSMPSQNLTFWRNSLELKHLTVGKYNICAIICSEYLIQNYSHDKTFTRKDISKPISTCVDIHIYRSHFLILTLYLLVLIILVSSQITFSLRKRRFQARIKKSLIEFEHLFHKWHLSQMPSTPNDSRHSSTTIHDLLTQSASSIEHSIAALFHLPVDENRFSDPNLSCSEIKNETEEHIT